MDFEIGNILYIVITLVAVIIGILGKKKKQGRQGSGEEGGETKPGFLENLERVLTMGQENPEVADLQAFEEGLPVEEEVEPETALESRWESLKAPNIMDEYDRIMRGDDKVDPEILLAEGEHITQSTELADWDHESGTDYFEIVKEFDARTAVIYSAIINRLDY